MTYARIIAAALLGSSAAQLRPRRQSRRCASRISSFVRLQILAGSRSRAEICEAHNAQPALLKRLGEKFQEADPAVWKDPRNSRAAVTFLLERRDPQVVGALRSRKLLSIDEAILDGAMAYVEGRPDEARARLGGVNTRSLPAALGAEIALVQSALLAQNDLKATIERLDEVRLLMPGTLVEEAALRREIFLAGQVDDFDKFEALAVQYFRRYRHSIYAGNFRQRFALSVARFSFVQQADRFPRLVAVLDHLDRGSQRALYLLIARTALVRGKIEMTDLAAERIVALTEDGKCRSRRGRGSIAQRRAWSRTAHEQALLDLQQIDAGRLSEQDAELLSRGARCSGAAYERRCRRHRHNLRRRRRADSRAPADRLQRLARGRRSCAEASR